MIYFSISQMVVTRCAFGASASFSSTTHIIPVREDFEKEKENIWLELNQKGRKRKRDRL